MSEHPPVLIACGIMRAEIRALVEQGRIRAAAHFLNPRLHSDPQALAKALAAAMNFFSRTFGRRIVVVYGAACLGFKGEMGDLVKRYGLTRIEAVNCIDCQLGGGGRLLEIDPDHRFFFLNRAFLQFSRNLWLKKEPAAIRKQFGRLAAIVPINCSGDLEAHWPEIERISDLTGLPLGQTIELGLEGVEKVLAEAIARLPDVQRSRKKPNRIRVSRNALE